MLKQELQIPFEDKLLGGDLIIPNNSLGLVIFVHPSGSSRLNARNKSVADSLNRTGFATFLLDLLTSDEELMDNITVEYRFNINLLVSRLNAAIKTLKKIPEIQNLPIGLFGASTGAAVAIKAAVENSNVRAIVSKGGRPELAGDAILSKLNTPTLLIVGSKDLSVLELNEITFEKLRSLKIKELRQIPKATHLFEEEGALEQVVESSRDWFIKYIK